MARRRGKQSIFASNPRNNTGFLLMASLWYLGKDMVLFGRDVVTTVAGRPAQAKPQRSRAAPKSKPKSKPKKDQRLVPLADLREIIAEIGRSGPSIPGPSKEAKSIEPDGR